VTTYKSDGTQSKPTITTGINGPKGVAVDANGKIYIANYNNNSVTTYTPKGQKTKPRITAKLSQPNGIAVSQ
jgi:DNA-binding beta-propeller fold protein YncE